MAYVFESIILILLDILFQNQNTELRSHKNIPYKKFKQNNNVPIKNLPP